MEFVGVGSLDAVTDAWMTVLAGVEDRIEAPTVVEGRLDSVFGCEDLADGASVAEDFNEEFPVAEGAGVWSVGLPSCRRTTCGTAATDCRHRMNARQRKR